MPECAACGIRITAKNQEWHPDKTPCQARQAHQAALAEGLVACGGLAQWVDRGALVIRQTGVWRRRVPFYAVDQHRVENRCEYYIRGRYYCTRQAYDAAKALYTQVQEAKRNASAAYQQACDAGLKRVHAHLRKYIPKGSIVRLPTYASTWGKRAGMVSNQLWAPADVIAIASRACLLANALEGRGWHAPAWSDGSS